MRPTITDVAKRANTTVATVSRVINNSAYVSPGIRGNVEVAIKELAYVPNAHARSLKTNKSTTLGVVVGDFNNLSSIRLAESIRVVGAQYGYTTFMATADENAASEGPVIEAFHRQRVAGIVVATMSTDSSQEIIERIVSHLTPIVLIGRGEDSVKVDSVAANFRQGGVNATKHLIHLGHRRIAFVGATLADADRIARVRGYVDALNDSGLPVREDYILGDHATRQTPRHSTDAVGYHVAMELLRRSDRPTAIFARNDHTAFGVMQAARELGMRIPQDLSVVGFDDVPLASETNPGLTTIRQPIAQQGQKAAEFLLSRIEKPTDVQEPRKVMLDCELVVRGSTAALPNA